MKLARILGVVLAVILVALPAIIGTGHAGNIGVVALLFVMLGVSFNLIFGMTGYLALTHATSFGLGAYIAALGSTKAGVSFPLTLLAGAAGAALFSLPVGTLAFRRVRGFPFAIVTLGITITMWIVADHWMPVTRGPMGLYGIPRPTFLRQLFPGSVGYFYMGVILTGIIAAVCWFIVRSDVGRVLRGIKDNEGMLSSLGVDTYRYKLSVYVLASFFAGMTGAFYAHYLTVVSPDVFWLYWISIPLVVVHVAGLGRFWAVIGVAVALAVVPEYLRASQAYQQLLFGLLLVGVVTLMPNGIGGWWAARRRRSR